MTKRELLIALIEDDDGEMDSTVRFGGNVFESADIDMEDLSVVFVNSNEESETTLVLG